MTRRRRRVAVRPDLGGEGLCQEELDHGHEADGSEGVEGDDAEDGDPAVVVLLAGGRLHEVVVGAHPQLAHGHQGGAQQEERLAGAHPAGGGVGVGEGSQRFQTRDSPNRAVWTPPNL